MPGSRVSFESFVRKSDELVLSLLNAVFFLNKNHHERFSKLPTETCMLLFQVVLHVDKWAASPHMNNTTKNNL